MTDVSERIVLVSDFNTDVLKGLIDNDSELPRIHAHAAPYGQVFQQLYEGSKQGWVRQSDYALVWTRPESVLPSIQAALNFEPIDTEEVIGEVDTFCAALKTMADGVRFTFIPAWTLDPVVRGHGMLERRPGLGIRDLLIRANLRLAENLQVESGLAVMESERWISLSAPSAYNPKSWYLSKVPFSNGVFKTAIGDIKAAIRGIRGDARKLVVVDLDDTLWGGIVGDIGWQQIRLGGHDPVGEAYVEFQKCLKALTRRGILLGIASKNSEDVALEAIRKHPAMVLSDEDFAGWRIDWNDKAANIVDLVEELRLGLQSVVFIDDNPVERARVKDALPEVMVPDWPDNKLLYPDALRGLNCFDVPALSDEDRKRAGMYSAERARRQSKNQVTSVDEWLRTLDVKLAYESVGDTNIVRATQLLNKTNQMNLSTRRLTETEYRDWAVAENHRSWAIYVSDRYGDSGLTGLVSIEISGDAVDIIDFVLSCRVMGRRIEEGMLHIVSRYCAAHSLSVFNARLLRTAKNGPCEEFFRASGMMHDTSNDIYSWSQKDCYILPDSVELVDRDSVSENT